MKYFLTRAHHSLNVDDFNSCIEATSAACANDQHYPVTNRVT